MPALRLILLVLMLAPLMGAASQREEGGDDLYYVIERGATLYSRADEGFPYVQLKFREPVYLIRKEGGWSRVRTRDGAQGYVPAHYIDNTWIRVSKSKQTVYLYRGTELVKQVPADLGYNAFADKERRGNLKERDHWRTPEGVFSIVKKNPRSQFYKAFVLSYPTAEDAERGLREGLISAAEYAAIVRAEAEGVVPPMHTALGGMIEIHGSGTGARNNWTQGCIAVRNDQMDELYEMVFVGTPVLIER